MWYGLGISERTIRVLYISGMSMTKYEGYAKEQNLFDIYFLLKKSANVRCNEFYTNSLLLKIQLSIDQSPSLISTDIKIKSKQDDDDDEDIFRILRQRDYI